MEKKERKRKWLILYLFLSPPSPQRDRYSFDLRSELRNTRAQLTHNQSSSHTLFSRSQKVMTACPPSPSSSPPPARLFFPCTLLLFPFQTYTLVKRTPVFTQKQNWSCLCQTETDLQAALSKLRERTDKYNTAKRERRELREEVEKERSKRLQVLSLASSPRTLHPETRTHLTEVTQTHANRHAHTPPPTFRDCIWAVTVLYNNAGYSRM